ncbi:MAG: GNAT family N-acetyltransferase [Nitrososphaerota archaeon]|nr:GNAT family N-acetyltransferase [Nitrososphaerota archaeon]
MKGNVRIREATLRDLPILIQHRRAMWQAIGTFSKGALDDGDTVYRRWLGKRLRSGEAAAFVAETGNHVPVGSGAVFLRDVDPFPGESRFRVPHIISMYTEQAHQGQGIASRIVKELEDWCRSGGYPVVTLTPTRPRPELYLRAGYERSWVMKKTLSGSPHKPPRA